MLQLIQNYKSGHIELADVPVSRVSSNTYLVKNVSSLVSIGTERSMIELGKKNLLGKARARPDLVKRFIDKGKKEGWVKTFQEAMGRLDNPVALGYSSAGVIVEAGSGTDKFSPGDRVACIGAGYASHAEFVSVPESLCCKIPDNVTFEQAAFGMLGIIAMHGIRCSNLQLGDRVVVIGLGLLGLLSVQILRAYGCVVCGYDVDETKVNLAMSLGMDFGSSCIVEFKRIVDKVTDGFGSDVVIITAATNSSTPVDLAVDLVRVRGRIVIVGVADIHPSRNELWHKEAEIVVSKAGGPGSLDPVFENQGIDYPIGYVRWTESRNLEEFLRLISCGKVRLDPLITHRFPFSKAVDVYDNILSNRGGPYIGVIFNYNQDINAASKKIINLQRVKNQNSEIVSIGVVGAGLFGKALLLPVLSRINGVRLHTLVTSKGMNAYHVGRKYHFGEVATDYKQILNEPNINTLFILTPHSVHAAMVTDALKAGKHVFVEKPLCVTEDELNKITDVYKTENAFSSHLLVGFNRRFSPLAKKLKQELNSRQDPLIINYRINAGFVPSHHWVHEISEGGGRIIGEMCHFVDLMLYFTGAIPVQVGGFRTTSKNTTTVNDDNVAINIKFSDGSLGSIFYSGAGDKAFSRERLELFCEGSSYVIEDFKTLYIWSGGKKKKISTVNQEMGYKEELTHFVNLIKGLEPIALTYDEIYYTTLTTFKIVESISKGEVIRV